MSPVAPVCHSPPGPCRPQRGVVHGILHDRLPAGEVQYCYGQQRAEHASLPQSKFDLKLIQCSLSHRHYCCCLLRYTPSTIVASVSGIHHSVAITIALRTVYKLFPGRRTPEPNCLRTYIPSAVPLPFLNPCCMAMSPCPFHLVHCFFHFFLS